MNLALELGGLTESVQITAESPLIDVKNSAARPEHQRRLHRLACRRAATSLSLVTLAPGANQESRSGGISIDGASASENKWFIDGVDTTNLRTGVSGKPLLTDFVEQVQVKSSGYAAEFGGSTGGVVNVITKSGSNLFHGDVGTYFTERLDVLQRAARRSRLVLSGVNQV